MGSNTKFFLGCVPHRGISADRRKWGRGFHWISIVQGPGYSIDIMAVFFFFFIFPLIEGRSIAGLFSSLKCLKSNAWC
jgi:hypothetical protein